MTCGSCWTSAAGCSPAASGLARGCAFHRHSPRLCRATGSRCSRAPEQLWSRPLDCCHAGCAVTRSTTSRWRRQSLFPFFLRNGGSQRSPTELHLVGQHRQEQHQHDIASLQSASSRTLSTASPPLPHASGSLRPRRPPPPRSRTSSGRAPSESAPASGEVMQILVSTSIEQGAELGLWVTAPYLDERNCNLVAVVAAELPGFATPSRLQGLDRIRDSERGPMDAHEVGMTTDELHRRCFTVLSSTRQRTNNN